MRAGSRSLRHALEEAYGDWVVLREVEPKVEPNGTVQRKILVRCKCGTEAVRYFSALKRGHTKSCQPCAAKVTHALRRERTKNAVLDYIPSWLYAHIREGARKRQRSEPIHFDITRNELTELYRTQEFRCALSGVPLVVKHCKNREGLRQSDTTASLDRIDSAGGYVPGNVQWVHKVVNVMKQGLSVEDFRQWCIMVANHGEDGHSINAVSHAPTIRVVTE